MNVDTLLCKKYEAPKIGDEIGWEYIDGWDFVGDDDVQFYLKDGWKKDEYKGVKE